MKNPFAKIEFIRITSLKWAIGIFCLFMGALMLVAPHQFQMPEYTVLQPHLILWGVAFFLAGWGLLMASVYPVGALPRFMIDFIVACMLFFLTYGFALDGFWIWVLNYGALGLGLLVIGLLRLTRGGHPNQAPRPVKVDLLAFFFALSMLLSGLLFLAAPQIFSNARYNLVRGTLPIIGLMFLTGSAGLLLHVYLLMRTGSGRSFDLSSKLAGLILMIYMLLVPLQQSLWPGILFYGGFGVLLMVVPVVQKRPSELNPALLRTRLALLLAFATALPLITTVTLISYQEEDSVRADLLNRQEAEASSLAEGISHYIGLHRAALTALSLQPGLLQMPPAQLHQYLHDFAVPYPDVAAFAVFNADGDHVARSDNAKPISATGYPVYEQARRTLRPSADILISPVYHVPIFAFGMPILDSKGQMAGLVTMALNSNTVANYVSDQDPDSQISIYLVDSSGRLIAHDETINAAPLADFTRRPPVAAMRASLEPNGSDIFSLQDTRLMAGYARVPGLDWAVVIERPVDEALAGVYAGRNTAFAVLLGFLIIATVLGVLTAGWVATPLRRLQQAASQLATGNSQIALPKSQITEIQNLAHVFDDMRHRLDQRTAEREQAQAALRQANEDLESKVIERTADLEKANSSLETYARALMESNRELQDFAHMASHDLQEPLRKIRAFGDRLVQRSGQLDPESRDYISRMQNAAERMQSMIDGMLAYSRVSTKAQPPAQTDLYKVACEVVSDLEVRIEQTRGQVEVGDLPHVTADPLQMRQLLQNLIGNGLKFHRPDETPVVKVYGRILPDQAAEIVVEDNGIGFDSQYAAKIFQPFTRLNGRSEYEGSGIGLAICRKIVERHSGQISASGEPGRGAKFVVVIPAKRATDHL